MALLGCVFLQEYTKDQADGPTTSWTPPTTSKPTTPRDAPGHADGPTIWWASPMTPNPTSRDPNHDQHKTRQPTLQRSHSASATMMVCD